MQVITSKDNEIIKNIKKLKEKKFRDSENKYIVEGVKIVEEAIEENADIDKIVICEECLSENLISQKLKYAIAKYDCIYVSQKIFMLMSDVSNPQGILAVINKDVSEADIKYDDDMIVVLDGIQDPGNLGTILRTVDSVNLKQILISKETADPFNPKVVRSTMGAIFRVNIIRVDNVVDTLKKIKKNGYKVVATSLDTNDSVYDIKYNKKALIIGNEANGVSKEVMDEANNKVKIPMLGKTESLNASVATAIILYEYVRQNLKK